MPNNCCLGEVECALGEQLLKRVDEINAKKRRRALAFMDELKIFQSWNSIVRILSVTIITY